MGAKWAFSYAEDVRKNFLIETSTRRNIMNMENLKRTLYISLSVSHLILSNNLQARQEDYSEELTKKAITTRLKKEKDVNEEKEYNLVGIALFSGKDVVSRTIKMITHSKYSHVGVILADAKDENKWYSFESTGSASEVLHGQYPHVRISEWNKITQNYDGKISYRLFTFEDKERPSPKAVAQFVKEYNNKSYTKNPLKLINALLRRNKTSSTKCLNTTFCSQLTAKMFMDMDLLKKGVPSNYLPKDFSSKSDLILSSGITLTSEFPPEKQSKNIKKNDDK